MTIAVTRTRAVQIAVVALITVLVIGLMLNSSLGLRERSRNSAAQALARQALMIQRNHFYGSGQYADAETLRNGEPMVDAVEEVAVQGKVYVRTEGAATTMAASTPDGTCYWIRDASGVATYATTPCEEEPGDADFTSAW